MECEVDCLSIRFAEFQGKDYAGGHDCLLSCLLSVPPDSLLGT